MRGSRNHFFFGFGSHRTIPQRCPSGKFFCLDWFGLVDKCCIKYRDPHNCLWFWALLISCLILLINIGVCWVASCLLLGYCTNSHARNKRDLFCEITFWLPNSSFCRAIFFKETFDMQVLQLHEKDQIKKTACETHQSNQITSNRLTCFNWICHSSESGPQTNMFACTEACLVTRDSNFTALLLPQEIANSKTCITIPAIQAVVLNGVQADCISFRQKNKTSSSLMFLSLASLHSLIVIESTYQMLSHMLRLRIIYDWHVNE